MVTMAPCVARLPDKACASCNLTAAFASAFLLAFSWPSWTQSQPPTVISKPLFWCYGADRLEDIPYARRLGLNTFVVEMKAPATSEELARAKRTVLEAHEHGLGVIVALPLTLSELYTTSLSNSAYVKAASEYVRTVVGALREEPGIIGWATGDFLERDLKLSDAEFRDYLFSKYGSLERLREAWGVKVPTLASITINDTPTLDDDLPFQAGMPSVDLADFQANQYGEMMRFWAKLVREAAGGQGLLFTGRVTLYRSIPAVPDEYDVVVVSMPPELLERDRLTHNVQAVDIARRGGKRRVIPCLRLFVPGEDRLLSLNQALCEWMAQAAVHGAEGACFEAPPEVLGDPLVQQQWRQALAWAAQQPAWESRPQGAAALLYEPYADGFLALGVPVYGYIKGLSNREPSDFINTFKQGTRYGLLDYLSLADLSTADLSRYGVLFAPLALDLPDDAQQRLTEYVSRGGVLVADIGAGFVQAGSWAAIPPGLASLFGVSGFAEMKSLAGNLTIHQPHWALPSLPSGLSTTGDFEGGVPGRKIGAYAVSSWAGFTLMSKEIVPVARLAMSVTEDRQPLFCGIIARDTGTGATLFATHRLWSNWLPHHRLFVPFHADLWQRRARIELLDAPFVAPPMVISENADGKVVLYNPGSANRTQIALYAAEHRLFEGAVCQFTSLLKDRGGLRSGGVLATVDVPAHWSIVLTPSPIQLRPYEGSAAACLVHNDADGIELVVAGDGAGPVGRPGQLDVSAGAPQRIRITVSSGRYLIEPSSTHVLRGSDLNNSPIEERLTADAAGTLSFDLTVQGAKVRITPS